MITLKRLQPDHFPKLYRIAEKYNTWTTWTIDAFIQYFARADGWVVFGGEDIIGYIIYTNKRDNIDIQLHTTIIPEYQTKWLSKEKYKQIFNYPFEVLEVNKLVTFALDEKVARLNEKLGFIKEGVSRKGFKLPSGELIDIYNYGMFANERKWK